MDLSERAAAKMRLVGGRLFLDFINTVGGRKPDPGRNKSVAGAVVILGDKLNDYYDLLAWSRHTELLKETDLQTLIREAGLRENEAANVLERAVVLREAGYRICTATIRRRNAQQSDLEVLNREIGIARCHEKLTAASDGFVWEWTGVARELDCMLWPVSRSAAELLTTGDMTRLHACGGDDCGWLFEDNSRSRSRQWCTMEDCGNLAKVRRFRSRLRKGGKKQEVSHPKTGAT